MLLEVTRSASVFVCNAERALDMIPLRLTGALRAWVADEGGRKLRAMK